MQQQRVKIMEYYERKEKQIDLQKKMFIDHTVKLILFITLEISN